MKFELPNNHGLSETVVSHLVFEHAGTPSLTDAQNEALIAGVGRGESVLVVSPTSTGKTQIALWAICRGLETSCTTVYLVTHRALAKQKFEDFKQQLLSKFLQDSASALVIATGDYVEDAAGDVPADPLHAPLLVATYEKYLALLSASGIPNDLSSTVIVCDEIQLIGDQGRGQNVEVLLTLLRNAGWRQFVGLSAVLPLKDARDLASWLGVKLVINHTREKHLKYECWTETGIHTISTDRPDSPVSVLPLPRDIDPNPLTILASLLKEKQPPVPIIVFCMKKEETYDLADRFLGQPSKEKESQLTFAFDSLPETSANSFLARTTSRRVAVHNADLTDEERCIVEEQLLSGKLNVVFATSTLAAGVNFPLGAAIFASWTRYDFGKRAHASIEATEFHNMAGRVGRMGSDHSHGRVMFVARTSGDAREARKYLQLGTYPALVPRISPERFNQLALQLVASELCDSRSDLIKLVCSTLSGQREAHDNVKAYDTWPKQLETAVDELVDQVFLFETKAGKLVATPVGRAVAQSGLLPETGTFLLEYASQKADSLVRYLPTSSNTGDLYRLNFLFCCACLSSPEFRPSRNKPPTRFLPWQCGKGFLFNADVYRHDLPEPVWRADVAPINASQLGLDWVEGAELKLLESKLPNLTAGVLRELYRNLAWVLQGFAVILASVADKSISTESKPRIFGGPGGEAILASLAKLPRLIRRLSFRVCEGLPDDVLWIIGLNRAGGEYRLSRSEILTLWKRELRKPEQVMLSSGPANEARLAAFAKAKPAPQAKANWLRDACRDWKVQQRRFVAEKHVKRARRCAQHLLVQDYYRLRGTDFEEVFERILGVLGIGFRKLDDNSKVGAPDYLIELEESPVIIVELKSRDNNNLVDYNRAVEVLAASEIHGFRDAFCVTLCHPGVDPSVPTAIAACGRLSVVESHDLGEALLRVCEGSLSQRQLYAWLASPGQALAADLPFRAYL